MECTVKLLQVTLRGIMNRFADINAPLQGNESVSLALKQLGDNLIVYQTRTDETKKSGSKKHLRVESETKTESQNSSNRPLSLTRLNTKRYFCQCLASAFILTIT